MELAWIGVEELSKGVFGLLEELDEQSDHVSYDDKRAAPNVT